MWDLYTTFEVLIFWLFDRDSLKKTKINNNNRCYIEYLSNLNTGNHLP